MSTSPKTKNVAACKDSMAVVNAQAKEYCRRTSHNPKVSSNQGSTRSMGFSTDPIPEAPNESLIKKYIWMPLLNHP
jgi:hypothetical protein